MSTVNPELQQQPQEEEIQDPSVLSSGGLFSEQNDGVDNQWPIQDDEIEQTTQQPQQQAATPPSQPQAPQQPGQPQAPVADPNAIIEHRLPTGHVLRGTQQQIFDQMSNLVARGVNVPMQYQQQPQSTRRQPQQRNDDPRANWGTKTFQEQWYGKFASDPYGAMEEFMKDYFGHDNPAEALDKSYSVSTQVSDRIALADFMANNPEWPATREAGAILVKRLEADGAELTSHNLEVAFNQLVREGVLARVQPQVAVQPQQPPDYRNQYQQPAQPQYQQPPAAPAPQPQLSRGAGAPPAIAPQGPPPDRANLRLTLQEFETLSQPEMRAYMQNHTIPDRFFQQPQQRNGRR